MSLQKTWSCCDQKKAAVTANTDLSSVRIGGVLVVEEVCKKLESCAQKTAMTKKISLARIRGVDIGCGSEWFCRKIRQKFVQFSSSPFFLQFLPLLSSFFRSHHLFSLKHQNFSKTATGCIQLVFANNVELNLKKMRYLKYHMKRRDSPPGFLRSHHSFLIQHKNFSKIVFVCNVELNLK